MTIFLIAIVLSAILSPLIGQLAIRLGVVAAPSNDRWHTGSSIPRLGGVAIFLSVILLILSCPGEWVCGLTLAFFTGLRDDMNPLSVTGKLVPQTVSALIVVVSIPSILHEVFLLVSAVLWIVFMMNAYNMLDNMDGTAAATGFIIAMSLAILALEDRHDDAATLAFALAGAIGGFFFFNFHPARIFMGDCGSHFIGVALALLGFVLMHVTGPIILLLFLVPVADCVYVTLKRLRERRSIFVGGRDHLAHDLHRLGFSERQIAAIYAGMSLCSSCLVWLALT